MAYLWTTALCLLAAVGFVLPTRADAVDDYVRAEMAKRHIPGMTVAVVQNGKVVKSQGYGFANAELGVPATAGTIYPLGSISKQFTAVGVMLLVREEKVGLDDAISKYVAELPETWRPITVRQLLNQTSGIPEWNLDTDKDSLLKVYTLTEIARHAAAKPLAFPPGTRYEYSNTNFNLLAGVIEKVTGKPYTDFLQERLFRPLAMTATGLYDPQTVVPQRTAGYDRAGGQVYNNILFFDPSYYAGAGGLQSTGGDLLKWDAALTSGKVLPLPVMAQMWTPPGLPGGAKTDYGMGWARQTVNGHRVIWHNGAIPGAMGFLGRFPDDRVTVVILSNLFPLDKNDDGSKPQFFSLGQGLAALYVPALALPKVVASDGLKIPDDPQVTALLRSVLRDTAAGTIAPALFTPEFQARLFPAGMAGLGKGLAALGPLNSLILAAQQTDNGLRIFHYQAMFGATPMQCLFALAKDGKIATLGVTPE